MRSLSFSLICSLKMWLICPRDSLTPDFLPRFGFASITAVECCWLWLLVSSDLFNSIEKNYIHWITLSVEGFFNNSKFRVLVLMYVNLEPIFWYFSGNFDSNLLQSVKTFLTVNYKIRIPKNKESSMMCFHSPFAMCCICSQYWCLRVLKFLLFSSLSAVHSVYIPTLNFVYY